jgi:hypothetical protein
MTSGQCLRLATVLGLDHRRSLMNPPPRLRPVAIAVARAIQFLTEHDRHHPAPEGAQFSLGLACGTDLIAAAVLGRPVPPARDDGQTIEITRAGGSDRTTPTMVQLYQQAWRLARARGYRHLITHTPVYAREITYGLHHVGLRPTAALPPRAGSHTPRRARTDRGVDGVCRTRWEPHHHAAATQPRIRSATRNSPTKRTSQSTASHTHRDVKPAARTRQHRKAA